MNDSPQNKETSARKKDVILPRMTYAEVATVMAALRVLEKILNGSESDLQKFSAQDVREMEHFEEVRALTPAANRPIGAQDECRSF